MPFVSGFLRVKRGGNVDNTLPGVEAPVDPGFGIEEGHIDHELPPPPPGIWPPPVSIWPPTQLPPDFPMPPGSIWPPTRPDRPSQGLPPTRPRPPGQPDQGLPPTVDNTLPPGVDNTLPPGEEHPEVSPPITSQKFLVAIVGLSQGGGLKVVGYTVVDPSLDPRPRPPMPPKPEPK